MEHFKEGNWKSAQNYVDFLKWKRLATSKHRTSAHPWRGKNLSKSVECENNLFYYFLFFLLPETVQIVSAKSTETHV